MSQAQTGEWRAETEVPAVGEQGGTDREPRGQGTDREPRGQLQRPGNRSSPEAALGLLTS